MHTRMCRKHPIIYINIQGYSEHSSYHTYINFFGKNTYTHAQGIVPICSYPKHLLFTNYLYMLQIFIVSLIFIYMHVGKLITLCTHFCIWKGTFMPSIYTWGGIPHHIFIWEAFSCHLWHGYTFFERLLMLLIHKHTYFEMYYLLFIHFARYFCTIYSHTLQHIFYAIYFYTYIRTPLKNISHVT